MSSKTWLLLFAKLLFLIFHIVDHIWAEKFYAWSMIIYHNVHQQFPNIRIPMQIISISANEVLVPLFLIHIFTHKDRVYFHRSLKFAMMTIFIIMNQKILSHDPRPWSFTEIQHINTVQNYPTQANFENIYSNKQKCAEGYGKPSGHTGFATFVILHFCLYLTNTYNLSKKKTIVLFIFAFCYIDLIGFSRLYLAAHSANQIAMGFSMGFMIFCLELFAKERYESFMQGLIYKDDQPKVKKTVCFWSVLKILLFIYILSIPHILSVIFANNDCDLSQMNSQFGHSRLRLMTLCLQPIFVNFTQYTMPITYEYNDNYYTENGWKKLLLKQLVDILCLVPMALAITGKVYKGKAWLEAILILVLNFITAELWLRATVIANFRLGIVGGYLSEQRYLFFFYLKKKIF